MIRTAALVAGAALAAGSTAAAGPRPPVSLAASPVHLQLRGAATRALEVTNSGASAIDVDVSRAGFALDLHGRPRIVANGSAPWFSVAPRRLHVPAGGRASATVSTTVPRGLAPGDHTALVLLSTRATTQRSLAVQMRIGVVVTLRVPGRIVHRLSVRSANVRRVGRARVIEVTIANRGNVTELLGRGRVVISLVRGGTVVARLRPARTQLLPRASALAGGVYAGDARGWFRAEVDVRPPGRAAIRRLFRIRL